MYFLSPPEERGEKDKGFYTGHWRALLRRAPLDLEALEIEPQQCHTNRLSNWRPPG